MSNEITRPVSARLTIQEFAKVRDSLIEQGISPNKLNTNSNIVKTALLLTIINSADPESPPSTDSINLINQLWRTTQRAQKITLNTLY